MPPKPAIAWFPQKGFAAFRAAQADAARIPPRWADWREGLDRQLQDQGLTIEDCVRVDLDLAMFRAFCAGKELPMDLRSRSLFAATAAAVLAAKERGTH